MAAHACSSRRTPRLRALLRSASARRTIAWNRAACARPRERAAARSSPSSHASHPETDEIVRDIAVQHAAKEELRRRQPAPAKAEQRVRGHHPGRDDRGDQRQPVGGRGDVAVGEPRARERPLGSSSVRAARRSMANGAAPGVDDERRDVLAFDDRQQLPGPAGRAVKRGRSSVALSSRPKCTFQSVRARRAPARRREVADQVDVGIAGCPGWLRASPECRSAGAAGSRCLRIGGPMSGRRSSIAATFSPKRQGSRLGPAAHGRRRPART